MSDDDIQFLGSKLVEKALVRNAHRPVTGIGLHIERSNNTPAYGMVFRRASTSVIHIGRRPGTDPERKRSQDIEDGNAMFRCAVVSRKHAKIALSDSGHAYLIDLGSHHGTHVRKRGEGASKMLKAETPALLTNGDIVTFGKAVGKGEECVRPITARVELLYGAQAMQSPIKPLVVPSTNSSPSSSDRSSNRTTGRYGVHSSPSSSDDSSAPNSDQYSDIEEIPAPASAVKVASPYDAGHVDRAIEVLKYLLPPSHTPCTPIRDRSPAIERFDSSSRTRWPTTPPQPSFPSRWPTPPPLQPSSPIYFQNSPPYSPRSLSWPDSPSPPFSNYDPVGFDASEHDIFEKGEAGSNRSRLSSPMDLASPSPGPLISVLPPAEPSMVGAWPASRSSVSSVPGTPEPESHSTNQPESLSVPSDNGVSSNQVGKQQEIVVSESQEQVSESQEQVSESQEQVSESQKQVTESHEQVPPIGPPVESDDLYASAKAPEEVVKQPETAAAGVIPVSEVEPILAELNALKTGLSNIQNDVTALQNQRRKFRSRFNTDIHILEEKVTDFDDRLLDVDAKYTNLADQVEGMMHIDIPDLLSQLEALQDQAENVTHVDISDLQDQLDALEEAQAAMRSEKPAPPAKKEETKGEATPFSEREDVKGNMQRMRDMVDEIRNLRDRAEKQTMADLEAARKIRDEILACRAETLLHRNETSAFWDETLIHRNEAGAYRDDAFAYRNEAMAHRDETIAHRDETMAHRDEAMVYRNETMAHRDETMAHRDETMAHRDETMAHRNETRVYRNETMAHRDETMVYCNATLANIAAREEMAAHDTAAAETTPVLTSLKRKRDDTDENEAEAEAQDQSEGDVLVKEGKVLAARTVAVAVGPDLDDVVMKEAPLADSSSSSTTFDVVQTASTPRRPRKRARKFAKAFVQTATAVTLGAVVTWSALAFS